MLCSENYTYRLIITGQLGLGHKISQATPQLAAVGVFDGANGNHAVAVANGASHACALSEAGTVYCWGNNAQGQLGRGNFVGESLVPVQVDSANIDGTLGKKAVGIASASYGTCAIMDDGRIRCWGMSHTTGDGTGIDRATSVAVNPTYFDGTAGKRAVAISGNYHSMCAVTDTGLVRCWGDNANGELGNNDNPNDSMTPVATDTGIIDGTLIKAVSISVGSNSVCAGLNSGTLACWGNNGNDQIGDDTGIHRFLPTVVNQDAIDGSLGSKAIAVAVGFRHACAVVDSQRLYCWGSHQQSQLGTGLSAAHTKPTIVLEVGDQPSFLNSAAAQNETFSITGP